jgi:hypothetical protein
MDYKDQTQALKAIRDQVSVTPQMVTIAKAFFLKNFAEDTSQMVNKFLQAMEAQMPESVIIHQSADTEGAIKKAAEAISWMLAGSEAIWGLISSGLLIPGSSPIPLPLLRNLNWVEGVPDYICTRSSWDLTDISVPIPSKVLRPPSASVSLQQPLSDPDLFLHSLDIKNIHAEVKESLEEAVRCFRHELYIACLAMLGKASEGAWIELGLKLADAVPSNTAVNARKIRDTLEDPYVGIGKKIMETLRLYEMKDIYSEVYKKSGVKIQDLRNAVIWADCVRESRNSVHYGVEPSMPNTYEKVAALLIGAVPHLRLLYQILCAVDSVKEGQ